MTMFDPAYSPIAWCSLAGLHNVWTYVNPQSVMDAYGGGSASIEANEFLRGSALSALTSAVNCYFYAQGDVQTATTATFALFSGHFIRFMYFSDLGNKMGSKVNTVMPWLLMECASTAASYYGYHTQVVKFWAYFMLVLCPIQYFFPSEFLKAHEIEAEKDPKALVMFKQSVVGNFINGIFWLMYPTYGFQKSFVTTIALSAANLARFAVLDCPKINFPTSSVMAWLPIFGALGAWAGGLLP